MKIRGNAVAEVGVAAGAVGLGQPQPQGRVAEGVAVAGTGRAGQAVFVVPGEGPRLPVHGLRRQVAVQVVGEPKTDNGCPLL